MHSQRAWTLARNGAHFLAFVVTMACLAGAVAGHGVASAQAGPSLRISSPSNGASVAAPVTVRVEVQNANLKPADQGDRSSQHLHYFVDVDPATVIQAGQPIPTGRENIIHSADTSQTLNLPPGQHTVWVIMSNVDHIPLTPPVQGQVSFTVEGGQPGTPSPAPQQPGGAAPAPNGLARTGAGGFLVDGSSSAAGVIVVALATGLAAAALARRRLRRT